MKLTETNIREQKFHNKLQSGQGYRKENIFYKAVYNLYQDFYKFLENNSKDKFVLGPHTDMAHRIITLVFYLAEDSEHWQAGTSQYVPRDVMFRCSGGPHYGFGDFKKVATAKFLPNTVFGFFKSDYSFHGVEPWNDLNFIRNSIQYEINDTNKARYYGKK